MLPILDYILSYAIMATNIGKGAGEAMRIVEVKSYPEVNKVLDEGADIAVLQDGAACCVMTRSDDIARRIEVEDSEFRVVNRDNGHLCLEDADEASAAEIISFLELLFKNR